MTSRQFVGTALCLLLLPLMTNAQHLENSWENLKELSVGQRIQVVDQQLKSHDGVFVSVSDDAEPPS
jgi:hypothetical protein